ncbi:MAG: caspase family protein [Bacteroidales bacterium]|nr:caspase family protein [Bacteroidales bacterium]
MAFANNGYFNKTVTLADGYNDFFITAVDLNGNEIEEHVTLEYSKAGTSSSIGTSIGSYYALIFAVNEYQDEEITDLDNPVQDGQRLYNVLTTKYNFDASKVTFYKNPTRSEMIVALERLSKEITPDDNLIIFYAGHGYWDPGLQAGYWLPADARKANTANWFGNSTLRDFIYGIKTKHTLLIADACFSGGIFKSRNAFSNASKGISKLYELPSRKAMTSGTLEEVPDKSVFLHYLIERLENNSQKYIPSEELFASFKTAVLNNSPNVPQYGEIKNTGDEGGDFIFILR